MPCGTVAQPCWNTGVSSRPLSQDSRVISRGNHRRKEGNLWGTFAEFPWENLMEVDDLYGVFKSDPRHITHH